MQPMGGDRSTQCRTLAGGHAMTGNSFGSRATLDVAGTSYQIHRLDAVAGAAGPAVQPEDPAGEPAADRGRRNVTADHVRALANWDPRAEPDTEIPFSPARVIMQDLTGVPGRGRPGRHARGHAGPGRRRGQDQPAGARRAGHRPLGDRRRVRPAGRLRAQRGAGVPAQQASGSRSCAGARRRCGSSRSCRPAPASCTRSTSSTWPAW